MNTDTYIDKMPEEDRALIYELTESLSDLWHRRHGGRPPKAIRQRLEALAVDMHKTAVAGGYLAERGLTEERDALVGGEVITTERVNLWASELRKLDSAIDRRMDKHGLLDPPEDRRTGPIPDEDGVIAESDHLKIRIADNSASDDESENAS